MLPVINIVEDRKTSKLGESFLFDLDKRELATIDGKLVKISGVEAVRQWVKSALYTERYKYLIYQDFGIGKEALLEEQLPYNLLTIELQKTVKEALEAHEQIIGVESFEFEREGSRLIMHFTVKLADNTSFGGDLIV